MLDHPPKPQEEVEVHGHRIVPLLLAHRPRASLSNTTAVW